ncbi:pyroglutamyl-peptidase I [Bdellovibrio sp. HCB288]|uniref:pyroglutamyl-peptidase I family protein n=1 Tax=Bdellovibrio sp. HCB288 TaxID=3394355 RepID=UPI0039B545C6
MKRILLTGFEAFGNQKINPSQLLVEQLAKDIPSLTTRILTVQFTKAVSEVMELIDAQGPFDVILMLGQAGGRDKICLERYAHNWIENTHADAKNPAIPAKIIDEKLPVALMTTLPIEELRDHVNAKFADAPVAVSLSAGKYVCNHLYFNILNAQLNAGNSVLFVHLPYIPEQAQSSLVSNMEFQIQYAVLRELLAVLEKQHLS